MLLGADTIAQLLKPYGCGPIQTVMRQALTGMLWSKQFYYYDVDRWLEERGPGPLQADAQGRAA